jgi:hypothetical protein
LKSGGDGGELNPPAIQINPSGRSSQTVVFANLGSNLYCINPAAVLPPSKSEPAELLPILLDRLAELGDIARQIRHALDGNGHNHDELRDIIQHLASEKRNSR